MDPIELICTGRPRHESRAAAHVEIAAKNAIFGRRHHAEGCPICLGFHVKPVNPVRDHRDRVHRRPRKSSRRNRAVLAA